MSPPRRVGGSSVVGWLLATECLVVASLASAPAASGVGAMRWGIAGFMGAAAVACWLLGRRDSGQWSPAPAEDE